MKILFILLVGVVSNAWAKPIETIHMTEVLAKIVEKTQQYGAKNVLVVFDIDNTLLATNSNFGSYAWGQWQKKLIEANGQHAIAESMDEFYKLQNKLYTLGSMHKPERGSHSGFKYYFSLGVSGIALTSRGTNMRSATERELNNNKIDLATASFSDGFPGNYLSKYGEGRQVSFQEGIYMTAGQNKGLMLKGLLEKTNRKFKAIIFIDDLRKHVLHVEEVFKFTRVDVTTFRYGRMDWRFKRILQGDKTELISKGAQFKSMARTLFE